MRIHTRRFSCFHRLSSRKVRLEFHLCGLTLQVQAHRRACRRVKRQFQRPAVRVRPPAIPLRREMTSSVQCSSTEVEQSGAWTGSRRDSRAGTVTSNEIVAGVHSRAVRARVRDFERLFRGLVRAEIRHADEGNAAELILNARVVSALEMSDSSFRTSCETNTSELYLLEAARRRLRGAPALDEERGQAFRDRGNFQTCCKISARDPSLRESQE